VKSSINFSAQVIFSLLNVVRLVPLGRRITSIALSKFLGETKTIQYKLTKMQFVTPNWLIHYRVSTFATKEPETLDWIDNMPEGSVFWDIGANIGLYSIYAAKRSKCEVYAVEPSILNIEVLARNILENGLSQSISLLPLALSNKNQISTLFMSPSNFLWGGAHNSIEEPLTYDQQIMRNPKQINQIACRVDFLCEAFGISSPNFLKIDVDGMEIAVLEGCEGILKGVESILIENIDVSHSDSNPCEDFLRKSGFTLVEQHQQELNTLNQIWRNNSFI
jgi:FkbM family methyltransferase